MLKKQKVTIKKGDVEVVVTPDDFYTWVVGGVAVIAALTFSILLIRGQMNEATIAFSFLTGMGVTEGVRHIIIKNTGVKKVRRK